MTASSTTPLLVSGEPRSKYVPDTDDSSAMALSLRVDYRRPQSNDPLVLELPPELWQFISTPEDNQATIVRVSRSACYALIHAILSVLAMLCCCYGYVRSFVVKQGQIALTQNQSVPEILGPGRHCLLSPFNALIRICPETNAIISHGPIKIIKVQAGELGYGVDMRTGRPTLLTRGTHQINSTTFRWAKFITLQQRETQLTNLLIVRVDMGYVGYKYRKGELLILQPGLHLIQPPDRFGDVITTQITILDLPIQVHETSDYVPLQIKSAVFYRIIDPLKALVRIQNVRQQIQETSIATLAGIVRGSSLSDVASRSQPFYHNRRAQEQKSELAEDQPQTQSSAPSAPAFFQHVHDEFVSQLHDHVLEEWGVEIQNIRIESLKINDQRLQNDISQQAIEVSKIHNKFLMLQKAQDITVVEAETRATKVRIDTDAEANLIRTQAKARADALLIQAEADKTALELRGQGESEYSRLVESTQLGNTLALMKVQAQAIAGIEQIVYVPHLPSILKGGVIGDSSVIMPNMKRRNQN